MTTHDDAGPRQQRRHRTGRNQQINVKATAETVERFNRLTEDLGVPQGEVLDLALKTLAGKDDVPVQPAPRAIDAHYNFDYTLTDDDRQAGTIKVDPYFVARQWRIGSKDDSGVLFHLLKNIARFGDKNSREREIVALYKSIKRLAALEGVELEP